MLDSEAPRNRSMLRVQARLEQLACDAIISVINSTVHFHSGYFNILSYWKERKPITGSIVTKAASLATNDWNLNETSWDFQTLPVFQQNATTLQQAQAAADVECLNRFVRMKKLEEENHRLLRRATLGGRLERGYFPHGKESSKFPSRVVSLQSSLGKPRCS